ncbi:MAG: hypothetical protein WBA71_07710 [Candidatus Humimicrobiia bacterium]
MNNKYNWIRYIIWVPWIGLIIYMAITTGGLKKLYFTYKITYGVSVSDISALPMYFTIVFLAIILSFAVGKRGFCHYVYWMSPFMIGGRKFRNLFK